MPPVSRLDDAADARISSPPWRILLGRAKRIRDTVLRGEDDKGAEVIAIGLLAMIVAIIEHRQSLRTVGEVRRRDAASLSALVAGLFVVLGLIALVAVIARR